MVLFNSYYNIETFFITGFSVISVFLGVFIIISKNPVFSVLFLIGLFFFISLYLISIGLVFLGLSYLLVYIGAISILFLFILMLINIRISELLTEGRNSLPLAILAIISFSLSLDDKLPASVYSLKIFYNFNTLSLNNITELSNYFYTLPGTVKISVFENSTVFFNHITAIGNLFYTDYYIFLIIISLILLLAMVGSIIITISKPNIEASKHDEYTVIKTE